METLKTVARNGGKYTVVGRKTMVKEKKREKMQEIEWRGGTGGTKTDPSAKKKRIIITVQAEKESLRDKEKENSKERESGQRSGHILAHLDRQ